MNTILYRTVALVLHVVLNIILLSYLVSFDTTGSWLSFAGFILALLILLVLFIKHLISFISFIKTRSS